MSDEELTRLAGLCAAARAETAEKDGVEQVLNARFRPLTQWPQGYPRTRHPERSRFRAGYQATLELLETELGHLCATNVVIQLALEERDIRQDGWPRANARPSSAAVVLSFETRKTGTVMFPCDTYDDWQDNLRAIALSLEALRAVNRYGVSRHGEQYRGWAALPPAVDPYSPMSLDQAAAFLARESNGAAELIFKHRAKFREAYRVAAIRLHPDQGGTHEQFVRLQQAAELLEKHHAASG